MSRLYYDMRDAKVNIAHELMNRGWEVLGYKANESDSMTDYYSPANWNGVATKNGFVLCIDCDYEAKKEAIKKYNYSSVSYVDLEKIKKLEALTQNRGATAGEEANAKSLIEKLKGNTSDKPEYEITGYTVAHQANPGKCKWHIEKDGSIYDKGTAISKYSDLPESYMFNISTMKFEENYKYCREYEWIDGENVSTKKERTLTERQLQVIKDFKALILKWERIINSENGMGDGTAETEQKAQEQAGNEKIEKVIEKVTKKVIKPVQVNRKEIRVNDFLTFSHHGGYWKVTDEYMKKGTWKGIQDTKKAFTYELVGSASRGYQQLKNTTRYYDFEFRMLKDVELEKIKIYELQEVEEITEIEKWVKVKKSKKTKTPECNKKEDTAKEQAENLLDISTTIMEMLHLGKMEYVNSLIYKDALTSYILNSKINITEDILKCLHTEGYEDFENILNNIINDNDIMSMAV